MPDVGCLTEWLWRCAGLWWGGHAPGDGAKSPGYVASPGKMLRHEPCCGESHAFSLRVQTSRLPHSRSSKLQHSESLSASSFFRLCLSFHSLHPRHSPGLPTPNLPSSLPPASRNFDLSPQILQRHPCPHGLLFSAFPSFKR